MFIHLFGIGFLVFQILPLSKLGRDKLSGSSYYSTFPDRDEVSLFPLNLLSSFTSRGDEAELFPWRRYAKIAIIGEGFTNSSKNKRIEEQ